MCGRDHHRRGIGHHWAPRPSLCGWTWSRDSGAKNNTNPHKHWPLTTLGSHTGQGRDAAGSGVWWPGAAVTAVHYRSHSAGNSREKSHGACPTLPVHNKAPKHLMTFRSLVRQVAERDHPEIYVDYCERFQCRSSRTKNSRDRAYLWNIQCKWLCSYLILVDPILPLTVSSWSHPKFISRWLLNIAAMSSSRPIASPTLLLTGRYRLITVVPDLTVKENPRRRNNTGPITRNERRKTTTKTTSHTQSSFSVDLWSSLLNWSTCENWSRANTTVVADATLAKSVASVTRPACVVEVYSTSRTNIFRSSLVKRKPTWLHVS